MSKLFVTVLGTGNYSDCIYYKDDYSLRTPFIQEAIINLLYQSKDSKDKLQDFDMKILLTEKALQKNYYGPNKLESILKKYNITPELVMIPEGKTSDELWDIFEKVSETIDEAAKKLESPSDTLNVNIDITHSLRNIPMQIVVAMNYLTLFNNINLEGIYYGAFELGETKIDDKLFENKGILNKLYNLDNIDNNILDKLKSANSRDDLDIDTKNAILNNSRDYKGCTIKHAPICNLDTYYDLLKWTNAINSFIKCGNTSEIQQLSRKERAQAFTSNKQNSKNIALLDNVINYLDNFTNCINTCRGMNGEKAEDSINSIKVAADKLYDQLKKLDENISIKPLKKLFKLVSKKIEPFVDKNNLEIGLATINWCIEYNLFQQGYTALEETIKTLLCIKLNLDPKDYLENIYENREDIVNEILTEAAIKLQGNKEDKNTDIQNNNTKETSDHNIDNSNNVEKFIEECSYQLAYTKEFCKLSQAVKAFRNDINHFGFNRDGAKNYKAIKDNLKLHYSQLLKFIDGEFPWYVPEENTQDEFAIDSSNI